MTTHSGILAWKSPGTEEPGGLRPWGRKELNTTKATRHACTQAFETTPSPCLLKATSGIEISL